MSDELEDPDHPIYKVMLALCAILAAMWGINAGV